MLVTEKCRHSCSEGATMIQECSISYFQISKDPEPSALVSKFYIFPKEEHFSLEFALCNFNEVLICSVFKGGFKVQS